MTILSPDNPQSARLRPEHAGSEEGGEFVLYWMATALRARENPALEAAASLAAERGLPLLVYQGVFASDWYATDRSTAFVLEGVPALRAALDARGIRHVLQVVPDAAVEPAAALAPLAMRAALVVCEDFPCGPWPGWRRQLATLSGRPVHAVDTACVLPMQIVGRAYDRAFGFRSTTGPRRATWIEQAVPRADPVPAWEGHPGFEETVVTEGAIPEILASMEIDHAVGRVHEITGGEEVALARWDAFLRDRIADYAARRNDSTDPEGVSGMSPYLRHGMIASWRMAREARATGNSGSEKFLDELLTWRELAWVFCRFNAQHDTLAALPTWARETLFEHAMQRRTRPNLDQIERGATGDTLFDLCQQSLVRHGVLHNGLRMTWGKAIAAWMEDSGEALQIAIDLNHRHALDGRDPSSYGGILWCFGLFDTPRPSPGPRLGTVRARTTEWHSSRLDRRLLSEQVGRPRGGVDSVLVIGSGIAGLMAARVLTEHGLRVTVVDKGRGLGGRMATRRFDGAIFDHGAQYFTVRDERFGRHVVRWADAEATARWGLGFARRGREGSVDGRTRFRGATGMASVPKYLAKGLDVHQRVTVSRVARRGGGWVAFGPDGQEHEGRALLITAPVPQALELLADPVVIADDLRARLRQVEYQPCIALLMRLDGPSGLPDPGALMLDDGGVLTWLADNHAKGVSPNHVAVTAHACPAFSAEHYEDTDEDLLPLLLEAARPHLASPVAASQLRRWRFSLPTRTFGAMIAACGGAEAPLVLAGDGFGGPRVEGAALSGLAAAGHILSLRV